MTTSLWREGREPIRSDALETADVRTSSSVPA